MSKPRRPEFFPNMKYRARKRHRGYQYKTWTADWVCLSSEHRTYHTKQVKAYPRIGTTTAKPTHFDNIVATWGLPGARWSGRKEE